MLAAVVFSFFWPLGQEFPGFAYLWQPAIIGLLYVAGQSFILSAVAYGDVSVATPVASFKVVIVTFLCMIFLETQPTRATWLAACLAVVGILLINLVAPRSGHRRVLITVALALGAALSFATFDVCVQSWSSHWSVGRIVPISFWFVGLYSMALIPWCTLRVRQLQNDHWVSLITGGVLFATQAGFLVYALSVFGDAARVNVVYALRGLWGVLFAWLFAKRFDGNEQHLPTSIMLTRLVGATFLVAAVIIVIVSSYFSQQS